MRGQGGQIQADVSDGRITPADAGTSCATEGNEKREKDHPRGCGDKRQRHCYVLSPVGSPPRMRGQGGGRMDKSNKTGITPADAGTRPRIGQCFPVSQDHPRGCGDKLNDFPILHPDVGSPPRMRGQDSMRFVKWFSVGITPADAGTSGGLECVRWCHADHPRGCGDKQHATSSSGCT